MNINLLSREIRIESLFYTKKANFGHLGGTFSCIEILMALYFGKQFNFSNRDFFILSKGHANLALLSILVKKKILTKYVLDSYGKNFGIGGQLDKNIKGIHWNTGSLGHSIGVCAGVALSNQFKSVNNYAVTIIGDSELDEGASWEAINFAGENKLNNLIVYVDRNKYSVTSKIDETFFYKSPKKIMHSYDWNVHSVDGHNYKKLLDITKIAKKSKKPSLIICETIKGKGVSFMENNKGWHHGAINDKQYHQAVNEILIKYK